MRGTDYGKFAGPDTNESLRTDRIIIYRICNDKVGILVLYAYSQKAYSTSGADYEIL